MDVFQADAWYWSMSFVNDILVFNRYRKCELFLDVDVKSLATSNCLKFSDLIRESTSIFWHVLIIEYISLCIVSYLESAVNAINNLSKEHTAAINDGILGTSTRNENDYCTTAHTQAERNERLRWIMLRRSCFFRRINIFYYYNYYSFINIGKNGTNRYYL